MGRPANGPSTNIVLLNDGTVVKVGSGETTPVATDGIAIAVGCTHALILKADRTVEGWRGYKGEGIPPEGFSEVAAVSAGHEHSLALKADGSVVAWAINQSGQPAVPAGLADVTLSAMWATIHA